MANLSLKVDFDRAMKKLDRVEQNAAFATSWAINKVIPRTQKWLKARMNTELAGGALPFTKNGLQYERSRYNAPNQITKQKNSAAIFFAKDRFYMKEVVYGGEKRARNKRIPEPITKNIRLTKKGNIPRNFQQQAKALQKAAGPRISNKIRRERGIRRNRFENIWVGSPSTGGPYGIYRTDPKGGPPKLMIMYKRQRRQQRQIWDAHVEARNHFRRLIPFAMAEAYKKYC